MGWILRAIQAEEVGTKEYVLKLNGRISKELQMLLQVNYLPKATLETEMDSGAWAVEIVGNSLQPIDKIKTTGMGLTLNRPTQDNLLRLEELAVSVIKSSKSK